MAAPPMKGQRVLTVQVPVSQQLLYIFFDFNSSLSGQDLVFDPNLKENQKATMKHMFGRR